MSASCGHLPASGLYYEVLGRPGSRSPYVFVHGGGASGACFRVTPDGRPGWAERLAGRGEECWVSDWPGCGRSGGRDPVTLRYDDLVEGYAELLSLIGRPVTLVCHSMGGAIAWKLVERSSGLVERVIALAASSPGNLAGAASVQSDDGTEVRAVFDASGVEFRVRRDRLYRYDDAYLLEQGIAGSTRFPREALGRFRSSLLGIPPLVLLQRLGLEGGLPVVEAGGAFSGLRALLVAGPHDPAHTRAIEKRNLELVRSLGAEAELLLLDDAGVDGNGHFFFLERNSDELLDLVLAG